MSRLLWLDYCAAMRERKVWFAAAIFIYAIFTLPLLLANPPPHVTEAMNTWFGARDPFVLFMFLWTDLAMNKLIATLAVVLAGSVVLRERDTGVLPLLAAKPVSMAQYFVVRAVTTCAVMATLYIGAHLLAAVYFFATLDAFHPGQFLAAASLHLWAAVFATALTATVVVVVGRRGPGMMAALLVLFSLVGLAFIGFYNPAWASIAMVNPISLGVQAINQLDALHVGVLLPPMLALIAYTAVTIGVGAVWARKLEV